MEMAYFQVLLPSIISITFLHALGLLANASQNTTLFILLRSHLLQLADLATTSAMAIDDVIAADETAIALLAMAQGTQAFDVTPDALPLLLMAFLPFYPKRLGDECLIPEVFLVGNLTLSFPANFTDSVHEDER